MLLLHVNCKSSMIHYINKWCNIFGCGFSYRVEKYRVYSTEQNDFAREPRRENAKTQKCRDAKMQRSEKKIISAFSLLGSLLRVHSADCSTF